MSLLLERQMLFARSFPRLVDRIFESGLCCTYGEAWRPPEMVQIYAQRGVGSGTSVHPLRLAMDVNLFRREPNGVLVFLTTANDHRPFGEFWSGLSPLCRWGGNFKRSDANHYSIEWEGRA